MIRALVWLAGILGLVFWLSPPRLAAGATAQCDDRAKIVAHLARAFGEQTIGAGVTSGGGLLELLVSAAAPGKPETWTVIVSTPEGYACLIAAGEGWRMKPAPLSELGYLPIHGDASWIMDNPRTRWCCGPQDCRALAPEEVAEGPGGTWLVNGQPVPSDRVYPSEDGTARFWACFQLPELSKPRCLFIPMMF